MKNTTDQASEEKGNLRKTYMKPQSTSVNLIAEEAVLGLCKTSQPNCEIEGNPNFNVGS